MKRMVYALQGIMFVLVLVLSSACSDDPRAWISSPTATPEPTATATPVPTATLVPTATPVPELTPEEISERLSNSVVLIRAEFPASQGNNAGRGTGTGIVLNDQGYILTNAHVVQGAAVIDIALAGGGRERPARIVATSACDDLAVLQVENTTDLVPATFGRSADLKTGEQVVALGFPLNSIIGDQLSITRGVVSQKGVTLGVFEDLIQTDTAINPGNSGGPLVNKYGEVIGINTGSLRSENVSGVNFAISSDHALPISTTLRDGKNRQWLGMNLQPFTLDNGNTLLVVTAVQSGSPADRVGVQSGDVLDKFEGVKVVNTNDVCRVLRSRADGDKLRIEIYRVTQSEILDIRGTITLGQPDADDDISVYSRQSRNGGGASNGGGNPTAGVNTGPFSADEVQTASEMVATVNAQASVLLVETFADEAAAERWITGETEKAQFVLHHNAYEIVLTEAPGVWSWWRSQGNRVHLDGNYMLELDVALPHGPTTAAGIVFSAQNGDNVAEFMIHGDGTWQLVTWQNGSRNTNYSTGKIATAAIRGDGQVNQLRVIRMDNTLLFYVNDMVVGGAQSFPLGGGYVGITGETTGDPLPVSVVANNFRILQLP